MAFPHRVGGRRGFWPALGVFLTLAAAPGTGWTQAGWYLVPSLSLIEEFDDNVFGQSSGKQADYITRLTLGLGVGYRSQPFTLFGTYAVGSEWYAETSELNGLANRQQAGLEIVYVPTPTLTLRLTGAYGRTETSTVSLQPTAIGTPPAGGSPGPAPAPPGAEVETAMPPGAPDAATAGVGAPAPGVPAVEVGPRRSTTAGLSATGSYVLTPRTSVETGYGFTRVEVSDDPTIRDATDAVPGPETTDSEHEARVGLTYQVTPLDRATLFYRVRFFDSAEVGSTTSHVPTVGWIRQFTEATTGSVEVGPRFSEGDTDLEASARLEQRFRVVTVSVGYARSQGIVAGRSGAQTTDTGWASVAYEPLRNMQISLGGAMVHATEKPRDNGQQDAAGNEAAGASASRSQTTYRVSAGLSYRLTEWLTAHAAYSFSLQDERDETIRHHIVSVGLVFTYPIRVY